MTIAPPVNLTQALASFTETYSPRIVARVNDYDVRIARAQGDHVWHVHEDTDEFFLVLDGRFDVSLRDPDGGERTVELRAGDTFVVPAAPSTPVVARRVDPHVRADRHVEHGRPPRGRGPRPRGQHGRPRPLSPQAAASRGWHAGVRVRRTPPCASASTPRTWSSRARRSTTTWPTVAAEEAGFSSWWMAQLGSPDALPCSARWAGRRRRSSWAPRSSPPGSGTR